MFHTFFIPIATIPNLVACEQVFPLFLSFCIKFFLENYHGEITIIIAVNILIFMLFGGDPRFIYAEILLQMNKWYDIIMIPILIMLQLNRMDDSDSLIVVIIFLLGEIIRMGLSTSHKGGLIPILVAFIIITFIPVLVIDFIWVFGIRSRTPFDIICMTIYILFHLLELLCTAFACVNFSRYQDGYYQFSYAKAQNPEEVNLLD